MYHTIRLYTGNAYIILLYDMCSYTAYNDQCHVASYTIYKFCSGRQRLRLSIAFCQKLIIAKLQLEIMHV